MLWMDMLLEADKFKNCYSSGKADEVENIRNATARSSVFVDWQYGCTEIPVPSLVSLKDCGRDCIGAPWEHPGNYTAHIETTNATGTTKSPSVEFVIGKPTYAYVGVSQQAVNAGSPMVFSCAGNGSSNTLWLYRKDGQWQTHYSDVGPTFSLAFG